jgi:hypothetical protein
MLAVLAVTHRYKRHIVFGSNNFRSPNIRVLLDWD